MAASSAELLAIVQPASRPGRTLAPRTGCYADQDDQRGQAARLMENGTRLAAIDLGSNSFRLEIGQFDDGQIHRAEYLKETVRLGGGLDAERNLKTDAMQRGWDCLARFAERLAGFEPSHVRAVATQTLREARNREEFLIRARTILGFPIDVISGREEARMIYQGVSHLLPQSNERRLVVDVGGRSTELILGQGLEARKTESYRVGSVGLSMKYFGDGQLTERAFMLAEVAAKSVLEEALTLYRKADWDVAYGSSGTVGAVADILGAAGFAAGAVTREGLDWLVDRMQRAQHVDRLRLDGLREDRKPVLGGGVTVLRAVFDLFDVDQMQSAQGALRHGVLFDLLDREAEDTDRRAGSIARLMRKFDVDAQQARRVSEVAVKLFLGAARSLKNPQRLARKLGWAAQVHELGCHISHTDSHKHGAYILDNSDASGFAMAELHRLSLLVLGHRGKLRKLDADFNDVGFTLQLAALRLAVILCHARRDPDLKGMELSLGERAIMLKAPRGWSTRFPQSAHLLRAETEAWQKMSWRFEFQG